MNQSLIKLAAAVAALCAGGAAMFAVILVFGYLLDASGINGNGTVAHILDLAILGVAIPIVGAAGIAANKFVKRRLGMPIPPP